MPFVLTNAPVVFQSLINEVFQDILNDYVIASIDDILVYSTSFDEHARHVWAILTRLQRKHLYVKPEKCECYRTSITFLGYVISQQGVEMDQAMVHAVTEWPEPTTVKELQRFLGFANFYQRFIRNYSSVSSPLTSLLRVRVRDTSASPVQWDLVEVVQRAHDEEPPPADCPPAKVYVPALYRQRVMQWVHESPSSGHSGIYRSTQLLLRRFWWAL
ncbi:hypothetical protein QTP70_023204 [Hemibagrus guttatus]|uniref:Gypsy retrotransposon integrase-like protein 1 n=1 Tax=Hemibagrus guttatus TaxID=175788 RepID=A0AAE0V5M7_9TELE|nr:hypothetical protein QTP70_023204 [Hemibagrus guttatus]